MTDATEELVEPAISESEDILGIPDLPTEAGVTEEASETEGDLEQVTENNDPGRRSGPGNRSDPRSIDLDYIDQTTQRPSTGLAPPSQDVQTTVVSEVEEMNEDISEVIKDEDVDVAGQGKEVYDNEEEELEYEDREGEISEADNNGSDVNVNREDKEGEYEEVYEIEETSEAGKVGDVSDTVKDEEVLANEVEEEELEYVAENDEGSDLNISNDFSTTNFEEEEEENNYIDSETGDKDLEIWEQNEDPEQAGVEVAAYDVRDDVRDEESGSGITEAAVGQEKDNSSESNSGNYKKPNPLTNHQIVVNETTKSSQNNSTTTTANRGGGNDAGVERKQSLPMQINDLQDDDDEERNPSSTTIIEVSKAESTIPQIVFPSSSVSPNKESNFPPTTDATASPDTVVVISTDESNQIYDGHSDLSSVSILRASSVNEGDEVKGQQQERPRTTFVDNSRDQESTSSKTMEASDSLDNSGSITPYQTTVPSVSSFSSSFSSSYDADYATASGGRSSSISSSTVRSEQTSPGGFFQLAYFPISGGRGKGEEGLVTSQEIGHDSRASIITTAVPSKSPEKEDDFSISSPPSTASRITERSGTQETNEENEILVGHSISFPPTTVAVSGSETTDSYLYLSSSAASTDVQSERVKQPTAITGGDLGLSNKLIVNTTRQSMTTPNHNRAERTDAAANVEKDLEIGQAGDKSRIPADSSTQSYIITTKAAGSESYINPTTGKGELKYNQPQSTTQARKSTKTTNINDLSKTSPSHTQDHFLQFESTTEDTNQEPNGKNYGEHEDPLINTHEDHTNSFVESRTKATTTSTHSRTQTIQSNDNFLPFGSITTEAQREFGGLTSGEGEFLLSENPVDHGTPISGAPHQAPSTTSNTEASFSNIHFGSTATETKASREEEPRASDNPIDHGTLFSGVSTSNTEASIKDIQFGSVSTETQEEAGRKASSETNDFTPEAREQPIAFPSKSPTEATTTTDSFETRSDHPQDEYLQLGSTTTEAWLKADGKAYGDEDDVASENHEHPITPPPGSPTQASTTAGQSKTTSGHPLDNFLQFGSDTQDGTDKQTPEEDLPSRNHQDHEVSFSGSGSGPRVTKQTSPGEGCVSCDVARNFSRGRTRGDQEVPPDSDGRLEAFRPTFSQFGSLKIRCIRKNFPRLRNCEKAGRVIILK